MIKTKKYFIQMILMLMKYQFLRKNNMVNIIDLNTLLGIMITVLLDHYICFISQTTGYVNKLIKIKQQCLL